MKLNKHLVFTLLALGLASCKKMDSRVSAIGKNSDDIDITLKSAYRNSLKVADDISVLMSKITGRGALCASVLREGRKDSKGAVLFLCEGQMDSGFRAPEGSTLFVHEISLQVKTNKKIAYVFNEKSKTWIPAGWIAPGVGELPLTLQQLCTGDFEFSCDLDYRNKTLVVDKAGDSFYILESVRIEVDSNGFEHCTIPEKQIVVVASGTTAKRKILSKPCQGVEINPANLKGAIFDLTQ